MSDALVSEDAKAQTVDLPAANSAPSVLRERSLMDFGWRFRFGNANDGHLDQGFGLGRSGNFQKTGNFLAASSLAFDDSDWRPLDLPHDWAIELPFKNDPDLTSKGFYPLGRTYPETSVGWYCRVFDLPAEDAGKRLSIEFDGSYRDTMVVLNGFYVGRHSGGYDPFSFDLTDFATPGGRNVLLVRVDATLSDGRFYEGAGIYRHVWMVKTSPIHVAKWGTFVSSTLSGGNGQVAIRAEVANATHEARKVRVISTIVDPTGKSVGKTVSDAVEIADRDEEHFTQQIMVRQPMLWSLEERQLYKLLTDVVTGEVVVDHYETGFGIRTVAFDAQKGFFLNGEPLKLKGTCNHEDHAGIGVALPDAVQYYRVRKLQEMGCNALRTSHNPPTPELLDACDQLGMMVLDETRMMASNPEGGSQFADLVQSLRSTGSSTSAAFRKTRSTTTNRGGSRGRCCICFRTGTGPEWKARRSRSGCTPTSSRSSCWGTAQVRPLPSTTSAWPTLTWATLRRPSTTIPRRCRSPPRSATHCSKHSSFIISSAPNEVLIPPWRSSMARSR
jgi:beta-galactosidase